MMYVLGRINNSENGTHSSKKKIEIKNQQK